MPTRERSPAQKLRDRQRCELAQVPRHKCKCPCAGEHHGFGRLLDHDISDLESLRGEERKNGAGKTK